MREERRGEARHGDATVRGSRTTRGSERRREGRKEGGRG
jgi:hypothetical protein